ncbi:hypothetical protein [Flammeovirga sp. OC4]|uniref:hypothetical protein n=1 Tax=Flammeovirga sp. OC4 TaxID=1382345 RepID=UPI0005C72676|nr:hypothetical protein [Flammeovirga sp. OC4]
MKKVLLPILSLFLFFSCNEKNDSIEEPVKEGRVITIRPVIEEQITPMTKSDRDPQEGLEYHGYSILVKDENGEKYSTEEFSLLDTTVVVDNVVGDFSITISHINSYETVSEKYYLIGEAQGTNVTESVTVRMQNKQFAYVLVDGAEDEVTESRIGDFELLPDSDEKYPNFYAYVQANESHNIVINTVRGYAGVELENAKADKQYTYSVNFTTDGSIIIDPGFDGIPITKPITEPTSPVVEIVDGVKDLVIDPFSGAVSGTSVARREDDSHQVWAYGVTGLNKNDEIFVEEINPTFSASSSTDEIHMSIYLKDENKNIVKVSMFTDKSIRDTKGDKIADSWEQYVTTHKAYTVHTTWADGVRLNCNFIVRIGWSENREEVSFTIDELSY